MKTSTPFFPGFHQILFGRPRRSTLLQLQDQADALQRASLSQLSKLFEPWLPPSLLATEAHQRRRHFPTPVIFWAFLSQALSPGSTCREALRKVQSCCALHQLSIPDSDTGAYCKARKRLDPQKLRDLHRYTSDRLTSRLAKEQRWCGRRVKVIDGTGVSMPDTLENQTAFPQPTSQKAGCGFPVVKLVGCFSLGTGALIHWVEGTMKNHEHVLFAKLWKLFKKGDVILTDRGFCSFEAIATLLSCRVDSVMRLHQRRDTDFRKGKRIGNNQRLVHWHKPTKRPKSSPAREWKNLPESLLLRYVKIHVSTPGFRTQQIIVVTTLTDIETYSVESLGELYFRRWSVELFFRDIKITLGMDVLRCKTPEMVRKEIIIHAIAYNLTRALMQDAATYYDVDLTRISFKGTVDTLRQWAHALNTVAKNKREFERLKLQLLALVAEDLVPLRPDRVEPRAKKRRPKGYQLLTSPRHKMKVSKSRKQ